MLGVQWDRRGGAMNLKESCKGRCSHDKATHHEGHGSCLAAFCQCPFYRDEAPRGPDTQRTPVTKASSVKPHEAACYCKACIEWAYENSIWSPRKARP